MKTRVMILGEVLGDVFPEQTIIGGAPYNVARHCHAFGLEVHLLTAVGRDALGARIVHEMDACGLSTQGVQQIAELPTGQVMVHFDASGHRFEILDSQAYDGMEWPPVAAQMEQNPPTLAYIGSLALRHAPMQDLAKQWLEASAATVFCDINLRAPWYDAQSLRVALNAADMLKINDEELPEVCALLSLPVSSDLNEMARHLLMTFSLSEIFVTCGAQGSFWLNAYGSGLRVPPMTLQAPFIDSVGAGDAYSAMVIRGILLGWSRATTLSRAAWFATAMCGVRGAVPVNADFYADFV